MLRVINPMTVLRYNIPIPASLEITTSLSNANFGMTIQISSRVGRLSDRLMSDEIYIYINSCCDMGDL